MIEDYYGKQYGGLTVIGRGEPYVSPKGRSQCTLLCVCECGNKKNVRPYDLKAGNTVSCGCKATEYQKVNKYNANETVKEARLHGVWNSMKNRCRNRNNQNYHLYGGRGIMVCEEWRKSYESFKGWALSNGYQEGLQIDRIDNDGNYEPSNCRWVTSKENQRNKSTNYPVTINGETKLLTDWAEQAGISRGALSLRISRGWPEKDLLLPVGAKPRFGKSA